MNAVTETTFPAARAEQRARFILLLLAGLALLGEMVLFSPLAPYGGPQTAANIALQSTARDFHDELMANWASGDGSLCGDDRTPVSAARPNVGRLRCHLLADSVLLVPGYVGLLVFFTLSLCGVARYRGFLPHLLCLPAVAAGLSDLAENGMAAQAAEQLLYFVLSDDAVLDVRGASLGKWWLLTAACAVMAGLALGLSARLGRRDLPGLALGAGGLLMALAALAWGWTLSVSSQQPELILGMVPMALGLLSLTVWRWRRGHARHEADQDADASGGAALQSAS